MKCPWCKNEMTEGFVISAREVLFTQERKGGFFWAKGKDDIKITQFNWTEPSAKAYHCEHCKKVVVDYAEELDRAVWI